MTPLLTSVGDAAVSASSLLPVVTSKDMSGLLPVRPISDIKEGETRWHAQVIVLDKSVVRTGKDGGGRCQKCLLQDAQGNMTELMLWDDNIEKFNDTLEPHKSYSVQGARVRKIKPQYQRWSPRMTLEWSIAPGTTVEPITNPNDMLPYPPFEPTDLAVVQRYNSETDPFDVLAAVVDIQDEREVPTSEGHKLLQDLVLVDQSLSLTPFTLWEEFLPQQGTDLLELKHTMPKHTLPKPNDFTLHRVSINKLVHLYHSGTIYS